MIGVVESYRHPGGLMASSPRTGGDIFFHIRDVLVGSKEEIGAGAVVQFRVGRNAKGRVCAKDVVILKAAEERMR